MVKSGPRTKDKEVRTAEIESAAKKVFLSRGYQSTTIQEIAEKAGVAKGTVYLYYKGKEDLYVSLMLPTQEFIQTGLEELVVNLEDGRFVDGRSFIRAFADIVLSFHTKEPEMGMIYQAIQVGGIITDISDEKLAQLAERAKTIFGLMRQAVAKAVELRLIADVNVVQTVDVLWGLFLGVSQLEWAKLKWTKKDHLADTLYSAYELLCAGLCSASEKPVPASGS